MGGWVTPRAYLRALMRDLGNEWRGLTPFPAAFRCSVVCRISGRIIRGERKRNEALPLIEPRTEHFWCANPGDGYPLCGRELKGEVLGGLVMRRYTRTRTRNFSPGPISDG